MNIKLVGKFDDIELYRLSSGNSFVEIITYGARLHKICVPDKFGNLQDVLLGFNNPLDYKGDNPYFNACIGRVANRIKGASFSIDGKKYQLSINENGNQLHGGLEGFDRKIFKANVLDNGLEMSYYSPDGEEGYPSDLSVKVKYAFENGSLSITYFAKTNGTTHCNLTNHAYFNLNGDWQSILQHTLTINASAITNVDGELIPTGTILPIANTVYDFNSPTQIGERIFENQPLLTIAGGYDFNYVLDNGCNLSTDGVATVCKVKGDKSGITMSVATDRPCLQFYSGNFLDGSVIGKTAFQKHSGLALETQGYPNACNIPDFSSTLLKKGDEFCSKTIYSFGVEE